VCLAICVVLAAPAQDETIGKLDIGAVEEYDPRDDTLFKFKKFFKLKLLKG
jgi:hypothetical protein